VSIALLIDAMLALTTGTTEDLRENALPRDTALWGQLLQASEDASERFRRSDPKNAFAMLASRIAQHSGIIEGLRGREAVIVRTTPFRHPA
jgi:hypothetical protein